MDGWPLEEKSHIVLLYFTPIPDSGASNACTGVALQHFYHYFLPEASSTFPGLFQVPVDPLRVHHLVQTAYPK